MHKPLKLTLETLYTHCDTSCRIHSVTDTHQSIEGTSDEVRMASDSKEKASKAHILLKTS